MIYIALILLFALPLPIAQQKSDPQKKVQKTAALPTMIVARIEIIPAGGDLLSRPAPGAKKADVSNDPVLILWSKDETIAVTVIQKQISDAKLVKVGDRVEYRALARPKPTSSKSAKRITVTRGTFVRVVK